MKIRLTESKLKQIVAESINKVLSEGKTVNNKLKFPAKQRIGFAAPGVLASGIDAWRDDFNNFWKDKGYRNANDVRKDVENGKIDRDTFRKWRSEFRDMIEGHNEAVDRHNERMSKYEDDWGLEKPRRQFGRGWETRLYKDKQLDRKRRGFEPEEPEGYWDNLLDSARESGKLW